MIFMGQMLLVMKNLTTKDMMKIYYRFIALMLIGLTMACADDSLDPFRFNEIQKGSLLALRTDDGSSSGLDPDQNFFFRDNITGTEKFAYVADFISEDQDLLVSVEVYARITTGPRFLVTSISGTTFVKPTGKKSRQGKVEVSLSSILTALSITDPATLKRGDIIIESDITLSNGTVVPANSLVNSGLTSAEAFFPAHTLNYYAETVTDFQPVATSKIAGEVVKNSAGAVTSRPVFPLKAGARDTVLITFPGKVMGPPTVSYSPAGAVTAVSAVTELPNKKSSDVTQTFFQIVEATASFTGAVTATITGSQWQVLGVTLTQKTKTQTLNVDNIKPQITSSSTGTRVGRGQFVTITINFNEKMSAKSANAIKATIKDPGGKLKDVTDAVMTVASNGLSASLVYLPEEINPANPASHGPLTLTYTGGADEAGNAVLNGVSTGGLTFDVGTPPAPVFNALPSDYDQGIQIKWSASQTTGIDNAGGAIGGSVYFVAIDAGKPGPTSVSFDGDGVATWTTPDDPASTATPKAKVAVRQTGTLTTSATSGNTGTTFTAFTANGTFDIYAVFVGSTGNKSVITATPQLAGVVLN